MWTRLFSLIGGLFTIGVVIDLLKNAFSRFVKSGKKPTSYGEYAVVTGATDGIGKAVAFELAKKGCNLILISRTLSKLEDVKKDIKTQHNVEIDLLQVDYEKFDVGSDSYKAVLKCFEKYGSRLGLLINNVGLSYPFPQFFDELDESTTTNLIKLNVTSTTLMTKLFLPFILEKKNGSIVNIGSFAGIFPSALLTEYSSCKAYVENFTKGLSIEYSDRNLDFQCHVPLFIVSKLSKFRTPTFFVPSAEDYAKTVVSSLGKDVVVSGHLPHSIVTEVMKCLPSNLMFKQVRKMHEGIRKKALKKEQERKKTK